MAPKVLAVNLRVPFGGLYRIEGAWLGANLVQQGDRLKVAESLEDGPAQRAGLSPADEILAWDGFRVDDAGFKERLGSAHVLGNRSMGSPCPWST